MASLGNWKVPPAVQPNPADYRYDLNAAMAAVVGIHALIPDDAFTAETLGTERAGNGVLIGDRGLVLTIGYLVAEAESVWLTAIDGRAAQAHVLAYDHETGFGLLQPLSRLDLPSLPLGDSRKAKVGDPVVVAGAGGRRRSVAARIVAKQEFAGYWEYLLDEAIFTAPSHPNWGGTAVLGPAGDLIGIGSLQLEQASASGEDQHLNMVVPIDLLKPILHDLVTLGQRKAPPHPWLGIYAAEVQERVVLVGLAEGGPAEEADLRPGDVILGVAGTEVDSLAELFRHIRGLGAAGIDVPLTIYRDEETFDVRVTSSDRSRFLRAPRLH